MGIFAQAIEVVWWKKIVFGDVQIAKRFFFVTTLGFAGVNITFEWGNLGVRLSGDRLIVEKNSISVLGIFS